MQTTGISLLLDLYDCQSLALSNDAVLEELVVSALQFGGFEAVDHLSHKFPNQGTTHIFILQQSHATLHTWPESNFVSVDVYSCGAPAAVRPALEIIRGYLTQKLIARTVKAQFIERGT
jgi:S-adenosylmethionine decarboxylase proenzyme